MTTFKNQTLFEFEDLTKGFTIIENTILNEKELSAKAVGIYCKIVQYRNSRTHKIYVNTLTSSFKDGRDSIMSGLKELENFGYIARIRLRDTKGRMCGYRYYVYSTPLPASDRDGVKDFIIDEQGNLTPSVAKDIKPCAAAPKHQPTVLNNKEEQLVALYKSTN